MLIDFVFLTFHFGFLAIFGDAGSDRAMWRLPFTKLEFHRGCRHRGGTWKCQQIPRRSSMEVGAVLSSLNLCTPDWNPRSLYESIIRDNLVRRKTIPGVGRIVRSTVSNGPSRPLPIAGRRIFLFVDFYLRFVLRTFLVFLYLFILK